MAEGYIEPQYGFYGTVASIGFFICLNRIIGSTCKAPTSVCADQIAHWKWKNLMISCIHAFVCGCWVLSNFIFFPELMNDLIDQYNSWSYAMVCFSVGYFIYDFCDMVVHKKLLTMWELVAHHVAITSVMIYNLLSCKCIAWNVIALSAEVNSFFLHLRKLLQTYGVPQSSALYRVNIKANLISFVFFRFGSSALITVGMLTQHKRVTLTYMIMLGLCMLVMNLVNPILFWRLCRSDLLRHYKSREDSTTSNCRLPADSYKQAEQDNSLQHPPLSGRSNLSCSECSGNDLLGSLPLNKHCNGCSHNASDGGLSQSNTLEQCCQRKGTFKLDKLG